MAASDKKIADPFGSSAEEQTQKKIFVATFSMLSGVASADGQVSKDEVKIIDRFMKNVLGLDGERRAFGIQIFNDARRAKKPFEEHAQEYHELLKDKPKMLEWMIDILLQVSCVDKEFDDSEKQLIFSACKVFGISEARYSEMRSRYFKKSDGKSGGHSEDDSKGEEDSKGKDKSDRTSAGESENRDDEESKSKSDEKDGDNDGDKDKDGAKDGAKQAGGQEKKTAQPPSPYEVLKLQQPATDEQIQERSKKLMADYNPTKMVELGLPEEFVTLAEEKFREIMQAYKTLKAERGF